MTFSGFSLDSLEERETYTETPADHFDPPPTRQSLRFWKLVPTVSTLAFIAGYLLWVFGGSASSQSVMMWAPLAAPLLYLGASAPARHLSQKKTQCDHLALLKTCRFNSVFVELVEGVVQSSGGVEGCLRTIPDDLKTSLNRLSGARWDLLAELNTYGSTLPEAVLEAFDKAAIPLMAFALNVGEVSTVATESRDEALLRFDGRVTTLVDKIVVTLADQATGRDKVRLIGQDAVAKVEMRAIEEMLDSTGHGYDAGMSELEDLLESNRELDA
jgi:hypothetical protein